MVSYPPPGPDVGPEAQGVPVNPEKGSGTGLPSGPEAGVESLPQLLQGPPATIGRARSSRNRRRTGAWPGGGAPRVAPDSLESVADDVAHWLETTAQDVSRSLMDGVYAPFGARINPQQQARYYGETLFLPTGQLDPKQWWAEYQRLGPEGLATAINGGSRWRRSVGLPVMLPVSRFQETSVGPTPGGVVDTTPAGGWPEATPQGEPGPGASVPGMPREPDLGSDAEGEEAARAGS
jgi:hypothetical protein